MEFDAYYLIAWAFLLAVFIASTYFAIKGSSLAMCFLWSWAGLLVITLPFASSASFTLNKHTVAIAAGFFVYTLVLLRWRNQESIETAHEETRRVLAEANNRMDEERRRIARQLHDDINPGLLLSKLDLQNLVPLINQGIADPHQAQKAHDIVTKVMGALSGIYQECRGIIRNTRIEIIDSIGLTTALESLADHYKQILERPAIVLKHNLPKRPDMPLATAVSAYRIIQEALLNAVKHAEASLITISIHQTGKRFDVVVSDDGIGISGRSEHGIGLIDMRERARALGAALSIESTQGRGTRVSFSFLPQAQLSRT